MASTKAAAIRSMCCPTRTWSVDEQLLGKVQDPVIAGIKVDTGNVNLSKVYPKDMPDLFKGDQLVVLAPTRRRAIAPSR